MTAPGPAQGKSAGRSLAAAISEVFAPAILVSVFLLVAAVRSAGGPGGILPSAVAVVFTAALPFAGVLLLVHRGHLVDHHISDRRQRGPVLAATLVSIGVGLVILTLLHAPWAVIGTVLCTVGGVVVVLVVNLWWKLSAHSAVAVFFVVGIVALFGPKAAPLLLVPPAVGWSRVRLRAHTLGQVWAGCVVGAVIGGAFAVFVAGR
ncbi:phosphatase PAP2 family protein [Arthrobacter sp. MDB2-24]